METDPATFLAGVATQCAELVESQYGRRLDFGVESLVVLDAVCGELLEDGALEGPRLDLWWKLVGAYTGEVLVRVYGGTWVEHENAPGAFAVSVRGNTAFPFGVAGKVLTGEPYKSLSAFVRALPAVVAQGERND
ncbi:hypothetical protein [Actinosynnema sp. NPDC020468]|uniref:hypothetical protein n=1 Tax=Actinosynnema sp. NPDC020468 TaxID=3154488 RepID=UPI0033D83FE3